MGEHEGIRPQFRLLEKKYPKDCAHRNGHGAILLAVKHILIIEGKPNMALIYPKSHAECRDSVFDGQIND